MKIIHSDEINYKEILQDSVKQVKMKALVTKDDGAPNFSLRVFELGIDGHTPYHKHPWEHEVYILEGKGEIVTEKGVSPLVPGSVVFVSGQELHQFKNNGTHHFKFLCIVPNEGHQ